MNKEIKHLYQELSTSDKKQLLENFEQSPKMLLYIQALEASNLLSTQKAIKVIYQAEQSLVDDNILINRFYKLRGILRLYLLKQLKNRLKSSTDEETELQFLKLLLIKNEHAFVLERAKKLEKISLDEVKSSSGRTPSITLRQDRKLHRNALILEDVAMGFEDEPLFKDGNLILEAGAKLAVIGENGVGKTTLLRCLVKELEANEGKIKWAENASIGYCPQDSSADFDNDLSLFDWMSQWRTPKHDDLKIRAMLGRLLFNEYDFNKKAKVCSGGEKNRLLFGKLMMSDINVLIMDEPTNHMDMEAIEALNNALKDWDGTLVFVSHDREFVSTLATRIIEIKNQQVVDFHGTYEEYLDNQALHTNAA